MLAPGTAEPPCEGRARRLLLRFACTALFAGGLWLCGATIAAAAEQPDGPPATTQQAVHTAARQGLDTVARPTAAPTRPAETTSQHTEQARQTEQPQHTAQSQHTGQPQQGEPQHGGQPVGPPGKSSPGLLAEVRDTVHSAVHSTPVLGHALTRQQQTAHERPDQGTEQPPQSQLPDSDQILPASLGSPAHSIDKQTPGTPGTPGGSGSSTTSEPARQHTAAKTAEARKTHWAKPHRTQSHRAQRASTPVPRSNPAPPNVVTATSTHAAATSQAADHAQHGAPQGTNQLPPANPDTPSANAGHSGANGDRGGNGGMFALTTAHQLLTVDPAATSTRAAAVRYASADRLRPGVAPD